ncbi:MAG: hypothetical protein OER43_13940 [Gammaproteobacteria bacterium]|nr:hypothetical protein [Gammaproteobacteria bacterium]MDH3414054.1 hypothetical protein [Gammaproteobacteria bacterium]
MKSRGIFAVALFVAVAGLSGCYEDASVTVHEPGKYKGTKDPLLSQQVAARDEALKKRFQIVQTDR